VDCGHHNYVAYRVTFHHLAHNLPFTHQRFTEIKTRECRGQSPVSLPYQCSPRRRPTASCSSSASWCALDLPLPLFLRVLCASAVSLNSPSRVPRFPTNCPLPTRSPTVSSPMCFLCFLWPTLSISPLPSLRPPRLRGESEFPLRVLRALRGAPPLPHLLGVLAVNPISSYSTFT
jgi:hypothetical protein